MFENAIDAGAKKIDVEIRDGGKSLIRISDDGSGMSREELIAALDRHATSKLPGDDLLRIEHLGFRGEALPSIGSVSRMNIKTREKDGDAWEINIEGGKKSEPVPCGHPRGTVIEVRDLFYAKLLVKEQMGLQTREILNKVYAPEIKKLESLLGRDLSAWLSWNQ